MARLLRVSDARLTFHLYKDAGPGQYVKFAIPKRAGGTRQICAPATAIKILQRKLNQVLQAVYVPKAASHGFVRTRNIVTNASGHQRRHWVLNVDLKDFFPSINFGRVRGLFMAPPHGLPAEVGTLLAQLACFENALPQGAPTSPVISNMICRGLDGKLTKLAERTGTYYSRYADDISFSTGSRRFPESLARLELVENTTAVVLGPALVEAIQGSGFEINTGKVRLRPYWQRQEVTGLVVNEFPNIPRSFYRQVRAMLHAWRVYGLDKAAAEFAARFDHSHRAPSEARAPFKAVVRGRIDYIGQVRSKSDRLFRALVAEYDHLSSGTSTPKPLVTTDPALREVERCTFVLECPESSKQGTGFLLDGVGLVTCAHVIEGPVSAYRPESPKDTWSIELVAKNDELDIAVLDPGPIPEQLRKGYLRAGESRALELLDEVLVCGYPLHGEGDSLIVNKGTVSGRGGRRAPHILLNAPIVEGMSGGPVLRNGRVVGVAATGIESMKQLLRSGRHGAIPVEAVLAMKRA